MYFNNNEERQQGHHQVCIFNQVAEFYVTSPLKLLEETLVSLPKLFVENLFKRGLRDISQLLLSCEKLMYATNIDLNRNKCILEDNIRIVLSCYDFTRQKNFMS